MKSQIQDIYPNVKKGNIYPNIVIYCTASQLQTNKFKH